MWRAGAVQRRGMRGVRALRSPLWSRPPSSSPIRPTRAARAPAPKRSSTSRSSATTRPTPRSWSTPIPARCFTPNNGDSPRHPASLDQDHDALSAVRADGSRQDVNRNPNCRCRRTPPCRRRRSSRSSRAKRITVETAIRALVTKSANDVAVVVAEALGGSEEEFARMMTRKARELGMKGTTYYNASGLPDDDQITTARDQALLGRAIQERFPKYYRYFATTSFAFRGKRDAQPQQAARHCRGRRWHQDRLHQRVGLQSRHLGEARRTPRRRRGVRRPHRQFARCPHARADRKIHQGRLAREDRDRPCCCKDAVGA